ncbi:hypothetical protein ABZP36_017224, partial [Zizania latifolia]
LELGHCSEAWEVGCLRGVVGELVVKSPSSLSSSASVRPWPPLRKTEGGADLPQALTALVMGQALVVAVLATAGFHISGGHLNPAVTLSLAVGGRISLF